MSEEQKVSISGNDFYRNSTLPLYSFLKEFDKVILQKEEQLNSIQKQEEKLLFKKKLDSFIRCRHALGVEFLEEGQDLKKIKKTFKDIMSDKSVPKAFLFGAGISMGKPFNLPSWPVLLQRAVVGNFYKEYEISEKVEYKKFLNILTSNEGDSNNYFNSFDLYELGQFIEDNRKQINLADDSGRRRSRLEMEKLTDSEMFEIVKTALGLKLKEDKLWKDDGTQTYDFVGKWDFKELISVLSNCVRKYKIDRLLTYNYDNAFEYTYEKTSKGKENKKLNTVFLDDQLAASGKKDIPIYHVHGYIPLFKDGYSKSAQYAKFLKYIDSKKLVLSEESYDDVEHSSYKWRNVIQIDTFLKYNCIFFGFSATDKNFKRIVKLMDWHSERNDEDYLDGSKPAVKHYIFLCVDDFIKNIFGKPINEVGNEILEVLNSDDDKFDMLITRLQCLYFTVRMKRKYLKKMHIYPIWTTIDKIEKYINYILT